MKHQNWKRMGSLLFALSLAMAACTGDKGDTGGPGASTGSISGTLHDSDGAPVPNATVAVTTPGTGLTISATSAADGTFTLTNVPLGTHQLTVSGTGITTQTISNVVVVAQTTTNTGTTELTYTPYNIVFASVPNPAGFGTTVQLTPTITRLDGGTVGTLTYAWTIASGPTTATSAFSATNVAAPTFTTGTVTAMIAGGKLRNFRVAARDGLLGVTAQNVTDMTYTLNLAISDGQHSQSKTVTVPCAIVSSGQNDLAAATVPVAVPVLAHTETVDAAGWTLDYTGGSTSSATIHDAASNNPWFVPDVEGVYTLKNGATTVSTVTAANWNGAPSAPCGACHSGTQLTNVAAKFKDWKNSAHGNHYWKYFEYNTSGTLVPVGGGSSVVVPTATEGIDWTISAPMSLFEVGVTGGRGASYSESCARCHTVGLNRAVANNGLDDITGYAFPTLTNPVPAAPILTNFSSMPTGVKNRGAIQCENCHGPLGVHAASGDPASKPKSFFGAEGCGVCHDSGSHHDRFDLWSQGGHSNLTLAEEEGTSTNCGRCHSAQGFVAWSKVGFTLSNLAAAPATAADVEPQTCQACHDPHTTLLRVDESASMATTSGFTVSGAGAAELCVVCHSSRRGLHRDGTANTSYSLPHAGAQSDLFFGQNAYFIPVADMDAGVTMPRHAYVIEDTCVGCHMAANLAYEGLTAAPRSTNHSFKVNTNVCGICHQGASFEALKTRTEAGIAALSTSVASAARRTIPSTAGFKGSVPTDVNADGTNDCNLVATFATAPRPSTAVLGLPVGHGAGFTFTWAAAQTYTIYTGDNTTVDCDSATAGTQPISANIGPVAVAANAPVGVVLDATLTDLGGTALISASSDTFKAWWNLALIEDEGSFGAHNPAFSQQVLAVSKQRADAVTTAP